MSGPTNVLIYNRHHTHIYNVPIYATHALDVRHKHTHKRQQRENCEYTYGNDICM